MTLRFLIIPLLLIPVAADTAPIEPGRWEITNDLREVTIDGRAEQGISPAARPVSACLSADAAIRGPGLAFSDPDLCTVLESTIRDGRYAYKMQCKATESADTIETQVSGAFTRSEYDGEAISLQKRGSTRIEMRSRIKARRLGDC